MSPDQVAQLLRRLAPSVPRSALRPARFALLLLSLFAIHQTEILAQDDEVIRVRTDLVTVPAFVMDARGRRVSGLTQADFDLRSDGHSVKVEYFATGTEHVALAFALDASGSVREQIERQREAALALFSRFSPASHVAVLRFGERAQLALPFTTDASAALESFRFQAVPDERTAIFDAASAAVQSFKALANDAAERRIIILISDGLDTVSRLSAASVIEEARAAAVSIYVIHLPLFAPQDGRLRTRPASKGFRDLAERTGGRYFLVGDAKFALDPRAEVNLASVFKAIEEDLQGQYVLGFYPSEADRDGRFHSLSVELTSGRRHRISTMRAGYTLKKQNPEVRTQNP